MTTFWHCFNESAALCDKRREHPCQYKLHEDPDTESSVLILKLLEIFERAKSLTRLGEWVGEVYNLEKKLAGPGSAPESVYQLVPEQSMEWLSIHQSPF